MHEVALNLPGRDEKIAAFLHFIRELGAAGICYNTYGTTATGIWSSPGTVEGRGGITARVYDQATAKGEWNGKVYGSADELFHGREFTEEELWENYEFFIRQVAPVAEEAGVFIGLHPDDPPGGMKLGGVPRTLFGTFAGFQRALTIADSPNIGVCLCLGCWLEAGAELMGASAVEAIRYFGRDNPWGQNKLFKIHFRVRPEAVRDFALSLIPRRCWRAECEQPDGQVVRAVAGGAARHRLRGHAPRHAGAARGRV